MIDRLLIDKFRKILTVSILELILFVSAFLLISAKFKYDSRKAIINILNNKSDYTIIIKDSSGFKADKFTKKDLFDKQLNFVDNTGIIYLDGKSLSEYTIEIQGVGISQTTHNGYKPEYNYDWEFIYDSSKYNYSDKKIDSLVQVSLGPKVSLHNPDFHGF
ncbi:hypothetical protein BEN49_06965 [Hymenobacter coccineus]|uniref:Uncharacterized protein n=2 Tax=Hymenobacter coccineus TaxID=1908235 RepID=A0A1G1THJ9_9BACT|nr:hypothetical protein BEN49_06965 [Hymenobacter coccineus]